MQNTRDIIEAICESTSFSNELKAGLMSLYESNTDIKYWGALREDEYANMKASIEKAFSDLTNSVSGPISSKNTNPNFSDWSNKAVSKNPSEVIGSDNRKVLDAQNDKHTKDVLKWSKNAYRGIKQIDRNDSIIDDIKDDRAAKSTYRDILSGTEGIVGAENISRYIEKMSNDVEVFVNLVSLLLDQVVKEAWIKSPETIQKVLGSRLYYMEQAALGIRDKNINDFTRESVKALQLAKDISLYFIMDAASKDIKKTIEDIWPDVQKDAVNLIKSAPPQIKGVLATFLNEVKESVYASIPNIIREHGDEFFLIMESSDNNGLYDPFDSSRLQAYHPIFDSLYKELVDKKPFNWFLDLESKLVDDKDIDRNLSLCASALVQQGITKGDDFSFPMIGKISGFSSHMFLQKAQKKDGGLAELLGIKESLWITSSYVPGMLGLSMLLFNVAFGVLYVAYAEDTIGFDLSRSNPEFNGLPIWDVFKTGAFDISKTIKDTKSTESDKDSNKSGVKLSI